MAQPEVIAYHDAIEELRAMVGGTAREGTNVAIHAAVRAALREVADFHRWRYYRTWSRLHLVAPYTTGTIAYDHTGGTYEREVTLDSGTWPSWAAYGHLLIDDTIHKVEDRKSDTVITLDATLNPGADVTAGETYSLFRSVYPLPGDLRDLHEIINADDIVGRQIEPEEWLRWETAARTTGSPQRYAIMQDTKVSGGLAFHFWPYRSSAAVCDFVYTRRFRELVKSGLRTEETAGTLAVSAGSAAVTGTSTSFNATMVGSLLRWGTGTTVPTGRDGMVPFAEQHVIEAVASTTALTLRTTAVTAASGVALRVTDPVDLPPHAINAFMAACHYHHAKRLRSEPKVLGEAKAEFMLQLRQALAIDSPETGPAYQDRPGLPPGVKTTGVFYEIDYDY